MKKNISKFDQLIYDFLTKIPQRKVVTYKLVANTVKCESPRLIGKILHINPDPIKYPCYKVVNWQGKVSENYVFGGKSAQIRKLKNDGIEVKNSQVDLKKYLWKK